MSDWAAACEAKAQVRISAASPTGQGPVMSTSYLCVASFSQLIFVEKRQKFA
jgi:hypothetical protein